MIAIYARQSVERPDSISIAMQVEHCRRICPQSVPQQVYTDRGFSGTNTRRPALQQMLEAVEQGQIESVYVYKLDRISRSLCDFAAMMQEFRRRGVTLHSVRESFDTQTEIGGMLLNLLMMFAELEQKTIAGRVRDNYYARAVQQLALGGAPHGTLVLTAHQQAGRGRLGRRFESPAGKGVYLSLILRPALSAADAQSATISAAVAVARAVKALCGLELGIKWVNDLYYQGRKVCGILTEAGTDMESGQLEWLVVGIGLNLITSPADWPEELARTAGSLYPGGPAPVSRAVLAGAIARELLSLCPAFDCLDEYRARCFVPGHWVTVCTGAETYAAKALSIDDAGRLVVEREGGRQVSLQHGEVSIRPTRTG